MITDQNLVERPVVNKIAYSITRHFDSETIYKMYKCLIQDSKSEICNNIKNCQNIDIDTVLKEAITQWIYNQIYKCFPEKNEEWDEKWEDILDRVIVKS